ncbi:MAG: aminodeoxychorismate synthase component I [Gordonia sp. (in: high G+C Gram-positive bacteria)]
MSARSARDLLRSLEAATREQGRPGPAALIGDWAGYDALIAPSIDIRPGVAPSADPDRYWLGYLGYPGPRADAGMLPPLAGGTSDYLLGLREGVWEHLSTGGVPLPAWVRACLDGPDPRAAEPAMFAWSARWTPPDKQPHIDAIEACLAAIRAGEVYQACVCTRFTGRVDGSPVGFYADLTAATLPVKSAFLQGDWGAVASFSPESFLRRTGTIVSSSPIKGTLPSHADPSALSASTKDIAENVMIVDLVRNDLGRVAVTGSVRVPELLSVVAAPGVWHLVSRVEAITDPTIGTAELLDAAFPPASVTGTPKIRACELIDSWEAAPRGVYCGAIGLAGPEHLLDLNVAIRTVEIAPDGQAGLGVGGGITIDSVPEREWQECLDKAASIVGAPTPA